MMDGRVMKLIKEVCVRCLEESSCPWNAAHCGINWVNHWFFCSMTMKAHCTDWEPPQNCTFLLEYIMKESDSRDDSKRPQHLQKVCS